MQLRRKDASHNKRATSSVIVDIIFIVAIPTLMLSYSSFTPVTSFSGNYGSIQGCKLNLGDAMAIALHTIGDKVYNALTILPHIDFH